MNWDAVIGTAEIIGVVAIVFSLVYVAAQIRQNTDIARAMIVHETSVSFMHFHEVLATEADLADLFHRGTCGEELSVVETVRFNSLVEMYMTLLEDIDHQFKSDLYFDEDDGVEIIEFLAPTYRPLMSSPIAKDWWKNIGPHSTTPSLYKKMSEIMEKWDNEPTTE